MIHQPGAIRSTTEGSMRCLVHGSSQRPSCRSSLPSPKTRVHVPPLPSG